VAVTRSADSLSTEQRADTVGQFLTEKVPFLTHISYLPRDFFPSSIIPASIIPFTFFPKT
jgi:hypothetical protein